MPESSSPTPDRVGVADPEPERDPCGEAQSRELDPPLLRGMAPGGSAEVGVPGCPPGVPEPGVPEPPAGFPPDMNEPPEKKNRLRKVQAHFLIFLPKKTCKK